MEIGVRVTMEAAVDVVVGVGCDIIETAGMTAAVKCIAGTFFCWLLNM
jgi:hypothetical protein